MKKLLKIMLWSLLPLLGLPLLLAGAWLVSNWRDAPQQAWPQALALPPTGLADAYNLYVALLQVPAGTEPVVLDRCVDTEAKLADCAPVWRAQREQWAAQRTNQAAFGLLCEQRTAAVDIQYQEPLPDPARPFEMLVQYQGALHCAAWLQSRAIDANEDGDSSSALRWLKQSQRLTRATLMGSHTLIGHTVTLSMLNRHLHIVQMVAARYPSLAGTLVATADFSAAELASAQRLWLAGEAQFSRQAMQELPAVSRCAEQLSLDAVLCQVARRVTMPNYAMQLTTARALAVHAAIDNADPMRAVQQQAALDQAGPTGLFGSVWHWRGTVPHILHSVAQPAHRSIFERGAQSILAAQATQLWLQAAADAVPAQQQSAWLAQRVAGTPLAVHLRVQQEQGGAWQLQDVGELGSLGGPITAPLHWPRLPG